MSTPPPPPPPNPGSEPLLRSIAEATTLAIFVKDREGRYTLVNRHTASLWGLDESEILGKTDFDLFPAEVARDLRANDLRVLVHGETVESEEPVEFGDRRLVYYSSKVPLCDEDGEPYGVCGIAFDITHLHEVEATLRAQTEVLAEAERRKDEFLAMLGHELRNPMAPLRHAVELFHSRAESLDDDLQRGVAIAERQLDQMRRIVDDLLDVARLTRGRVRLEREPMPIRSSLETAIETVRPYFEHRKSRLELTLPDPELRVDGDRARLVQVFSNLLHNAAKYTPVGGRIHLEVAADEEWVTTEIRDEGIGMEPSVLSQAFDIFYQREPGLDRTEGGLGVGLTLARSLVDLHGGELTAESAGEGAGSLFRVLIVDDNRDSADSLGALLELGGHEVEIVYDGESGLKAAERFEPDVVLLDIGLPRLDGYEVARRLRDRGADDLLIVAITGYGQESARERSAEAGFDHHLLKPVDLDALRRLVAEAGMRAAT